MTAAVWTSWSSQFIFKGSPHIKWIILIYLKGTRGYTAVPLFPESLQRVYQLHLGIDFPHHDHCLFFELESWIQ